MSNKVSYVTKEGLKKLQEELERLQNVERPKISKAIGEAIEKAIFQRTRNMMQPKMPRGFWKQK